VGARAIRHEATEGFGGVTERHNAIGPNSLRIVIVCAIASDPCIVPWRATLL